MVSNEGGLAERGFCFNRTGDSGKKHGQEGVLTLKEVERCWKGALAKRGQVGGWAYTGSPWISLAQEQPSTVPTRSPALWQDGLLHHPASNQEGRRAIGAVVAAVLVEVECGL